MTITIDETTRATLRQLRLSTFADVYFALLNEEHNADALPEDIFLKAVDQAALQRRERNIAKTIQQAHFHYPSASLAELIEPDKRGINERQLKRIATTKWREHPSNIHLFAPAGTGKTYIACAIGIAACQSGHTVAYYRLDQLADTLGRYEATDQRYIDLMRRLANIDLLIIDDFLTLTISPRGQDDLTKIIIERDGRLPTIISSQSTARYWIETLPNRVGADTLVSRLNNGQRIHIGDYDMRKHLAPTTE